MSAAFTVAVTAIESLGFLAPLPQSFLATITTYVPLLIASIATYWAQQDYASSGLQTQTLVDAPETYEFIVVGAGSAGAAVAGRLSEKYRVLLLEAGGDPLPITYVPFLAPMLANQPLIDWQHQSCQNNTNPSRNIEQACRSVPRGKSLGGTSNLNWMLYMRGSPEDYNNWAEHTGDNRWAYENVQKMFRRIEDYHGHWPNNGYHNVGGPMRIEKSKYSPSGNYWLQAGRELGYEVNDPNGYQNQGFNPVDMTQKGGMRFSTFRGYIEPALKRENLVIHRYSLATKIHFDSNMRAIGVGYLRHGIPRYAQVTKEIVVSGGAINSPQLLMLSGIGPKEHLTQHKIPCLVDLPVGQNYQDHVFAIGPSYLFEKPVSNVISRDLNWDAFRSYLEAGTGPFSVPAPLSGTAYLASSLSPKNWPDLLIHLVGSGPSAMLGKTLDDLYSYPNNALETLYAKDEGKDGNFVIAMLGRPKSRGEILLRDANPLSHPLINPKQRYGFHSDDLSRMVEVLNYTLTIFESTATYAELGSRLSPHRITGCEQFELRTTSYFECLAKLLSASGFHPSSTCSMGQPGDTNAVVDSQLRVMGTTGLRVADTSIMPFIINANPNVPSIMIGEMCADMIMQDWN